MRKKGRRVKSMRGETVDFDLLEIKQQIASRPKPVEVKAREQFVDERLRRRVRRLEDKVKAIAAEQQSKEQEKIKQQEPEQAKVETKKVAPSPALKELPKESNEKAPKRRYYRKKKEDKE